MDTATEKALEVPSQEAQEVDGLIARKGAHLLEKCASAVAAGVVLSACAGVPARPPQRECSREARAAMDQLNIPDGDSEHVLLDVNRPGFASDHSIFRDGPLVSSLDEPFGDLPPGTLVYGYLWTGGKNIVAHYDRVKLPTGEVFPVCFALGDDQRDKGWPNLYGSPAPGSVKSSLLVPLVRVDRFEGE